MTALMNRKVLVLNKGWNPIAIVSLERAMCLVVGDYANGDAKARIIDATQDFRLFTWEDWSLLKAGEGEAVIRSSTEAFRVPEIILLSKYNSLPQQRVHFSRRTIYRRDANQCQYCGAKPGTTELSLDHILPRSRGGKTEWTNICLACTKCNRRKADRTMQEAGMTFFHPGYKPRKPKFVLFKGDYRCDSWAAILGESYWSTELINDIKE